MSGKISIIGTSHIAKESVSRIREEIHSQRPDFVAIELDPTRFQELMSHKRKLRKAKLSDIRRIGVFGWLFAIIGAFIQRRLGKQAGEKPGSDMKSAVVAAREVGSQIVLVDRDISITVQRMSKNVPLREKLYLVWFLLFGWIFERKEFKNIQKFDLKKVPSSDVIHKLVIHLKHKFPHLYKVLVTERNKYMARRILFLHNQYPDANILAVVGAGHLEGMKNIFERSK